MRRVPAIGPAVAIIAAAIALSAAASATIRRPAAPPRYYMQCLALRSVGNDINAVASQGWTVAAMVDHVGQDGQECLLVLFERPGQ